MRNAEDEARVLELKELVKKLGIEVGPLIPSSKVTLFDCNLHQDNIEFVLNASYDELLSWLGRASVGVSSMVDEHFGINVVEFMVCIICVFFISR